MELIKYGVYGLSEWIALITLGKREFKLHFTGGITSGGGVIPATFETKNPIVQLAIMQSSHFKEGRIKIVKSLKIDDTPFIDKNEEEDTDNPNSGGPVDEGGEELPTDDEPPKPIEVEVGSMAEAIDYLQENFPKNMEGVIITRKSDAIEKGVSLGVMFKGL